MVDPKERTEGAGAQTPAPDEPEMPAAAEPELTDAPAVEESSLDEPAPEPTAAELDERLALAERDRDDYLALAQRTQADFDNYRRRMARELKATEARGLTRLAREMLPALDNLGRALAAAEAHDEEAPEHHLAEGIRLVHAELLAALARVGIEPYSPRGERFDPNEHEAMASQPVDGAEPGTVVEVYQQGYRLNGTILRPARVVVAG